MRRAVAAASSPVREFEPEKGRLLGSLLRATRYVPREVAEGFSVQLRALRFG
jgi:hypothetical protein